MKENGCFILEKITSQVRTIIPRISIVFYYLVLYRGFGFNEMIYKIN